MMTNCTDTPFRAAGDGYAPEILAQWCGVTVCTIGRWETGATRAPASAVRLVGMLARGELPPLAGDMWGGWRFGHDGLLYAPGWGVGFTPGDIRAAHYLAQHDGQRAARERTLAPLRALDHSPALPLRPFTFAICAAIASPAAG
jgi:hypothetical protein